MIKVAQELPFKAAESTESMSDTFVSNRTVAETAALLRLIFRSNRVTLSKSEVSIKVPTNQLGDVLGKFAWHGIKNEVTIDLTD